MPRIDSTGGVDINAYSGDHPPPHIHALYNDDEALVVIETSEIYAGELPNAQYRLVVKWLETGDNRENALAIFNALNPQLTRKAPKKTGKKNNNKNKK